MKVVKDYYKFIWNGRSFVLWNYNKSLLSEDVGVMDFYFKIDGVKMVYQNDICYFEYKNITFLKVDCLYYRVYVLNTIYYEICQLKTSLFLFKHHTSLGVFNDLEEIKELKKTYKFNSVDNYLYRQWIRLYNKLKDLETENEDSVQELEYVK
ncbi:MAG: hypothetical protein ACO2O4_00700 [Minisyncoccia bacterium]|jgi:hypothetical protein